MNAESRIAHLVFNRHSGKGRGLALTEEAKTLCQELGYQLHLYDVADGQFETQSQRAVQKAEADGGILMAAGGDGTIRGVAQAAHGKNIRFGAIPCGTFNFFARTHEISEEPAEALRAALTGSPKPVRLGEINGQIFLINASLGLYAKAIRERESRTSRFGRNRLVVIISTMLSLLSRHFLLRVDLATREMVTSFYTPMIFIGNNALQLRDLKLSVAQCMKAQMLAVVCMKPVGKLETLRILFRGFAKTLDNEERLATFCVDEMTIYTRKSHHQIALDGEVMTMTSPLKVRALPGVLQLMVAPPRASS